jgi:predicted RecB family nuclease
MDSYESKAIDKLGKRYQTALGNLKNRLVNLNTYIYGKVYFPVKSNRLKEIGNFIGASWTSPHASGLQALVWRYYWDETQDVKYYDFLITYNVSVQLV